MNLQHWRKFTAAVVISLLVPHSLTAGVNSREAKYSGGSVSTPVVGATGVFDTTGEEQFSFKYKAGKARGTGGYPEGFVNVPYRNISRMTFGDVKHLRIGETIALTALAGVGGLLLLLSKSHTHYLAITYRDVKGEEQVMNFEVGKEAIRSVTSSLELRTGKKVELEAVPIAPAKKTL